MATAWYKPRAVPKLLHSFASPNSSASIQVWNTSCIVRHFGKQHGRFTVLINPSNPSLLGVRKFPYFPRGGPEPTAPPNKDSHHLMGYVTQWGGMDLQRGMLFAGNVVDGLVHELGGWSLMLQCYLLNLRAAITKEEVCPVGNAVAMPVWDHCPLGKEYNRIVHAVPPFYQYHDDPEDALACCYRSAFDLAFGGDTHVACPLLGAGGRGFPIERAIRIAAQESSRWRKVAARKESTEPLVLAFGILDPSIAETLAEEIAMNLDGTRSEDNTRARERGNSDERIRLQAEATAR